MENILRDINAEPQGDTLTNLKQLEEMRKIEEQMKKELENMNKNADVNQVNQQKVKVVEKTQTNYTAMALITLIVSIVILYYAYKYFNMDISKFPVFANVSAGLLTFSAVINLFYSFYIMFYT